MTDYARLARELKPFILPWVTGAGGGASSISGSGAAAHDLAGPLHTGTLAQSQAPWAATVASLLAHANNPDAHHLRLHTLDSTADHSGLLSWARLSKTGASLADLPTRLYADLQSRTHSVTGSDHSIAGSPFDVVGNAGGLLGLLTPLADVSAGATALLRSQAGALGLSRLFSGAGLQLDAVGDIIVDAGGADVIFDFDDALRSATYAAGFPLAGWRLGKHANVAGQSVLQVGRLEADEVMAKTFVADLVRVDQGQEYITKGFGLLSRPFTTPGSIGGTVTIYFENSPHIAGALFTSNDWVLLRYLDLSSGFVLTSVWGQVSGYAVVGASEQSWTFTLRSGTTGLAFQKGAFATGFGASGQGYILSDAASATSPSITIGRWTTNPYTPANRAVVAAMGRLDAVGFSGEYGFAASAGDWSTAGIWWKAGTGGVKHNNVDAEWYSGGTLIARIRSTGNPRFYVGNGADKYVQFDGTNVTWAAGNSSINAAGTLTATNAVLSGTVTATAGQIAGFSISGTSLVANGSAYILAAASLRLSYAGEGASIALPDNTSYYSALAIYNSGFAQRQAALVPYRTTGGNAGWILEGMLGLDVFGPLSVGGAASVASLASSGNVNAANLVVSGYGSFNGGALVAQHASAPYYGFSIQASAAGGWARKFGFFYSTSDLGGFGAYGTAGALEYWWVGNAYTDRTLLIYPTTHASYPGAVNVAGTLTAASLNAAMGYQRDGVQGNIVTLVTPVDLTDNVGTLWAGSASKAVGSYTFDVNTAANGSVPTEATGAVILITGQFASANQNHYALVKRYGDVDSDATILLRAAVANINTDHQGLVRIDANGLFEVKVVGATMNSAACRLVAYLI